VVERKNDARISLQEYVNALFKALEPADTDGVLLSGVIAPAPLGLAFSRLEIGTLSSAPSSW